MSTVYVKVDDGLDVPTKLDKIEKVILKKKKNLDTIEIERKDRLLALQEKRRQSDAPKRMKFVRAEKLIKDNRKEQKNKIRMKRVNHQMRLLGKPEVNSRVYLVIRIRGNNGVTNDLKAIFRRLRIPALHCASLLKCSGDIPALLKLAEPYITYGVPTAKTIKDLIYKHGHARIDGNRVPLTDNALIEEHLGEHNIICIEDIIHELITGGPAFKQVLKFLWSFRLHYPKNGFVNTRKPFNDGGDSGDRSEKINDLAIQMM